MVGVCFGPNNHQYDYNIISAEWAIPASEDMFISHANYSSRAHILVQPLLHPHLFTDTREQTSCTPEHSKSWWLS